MTIRGNQRKSVDNAEKRERVKWAGKAERLKRGPIDRATEEALIEAAVASGKVTRFPMANTDETVAVIRGYSPALRAMPTAGTSFGDFSRKGLR